VEPSVVICAYTEDRWDDTLLAVDSVRGQISPAHEIILVIDHNPALFRRAQAAIPGITIVENNQARGLGGARNTGIATARGDIVVFLDDDAEAEPDWLQELLAGYETDDVASVGGASIAGWRKGRPGWFPPEFDWVVGCAYVGLPTVTAPVRNPFGSNMSFRRTALEDLGGFQLGYGCDETELCIRLHRRWPSSKVMYRPQARVLHKVPANRGSLRYFVSRCYFEGRSKAVVAWLWGPGDALASERAYTARVLPRGVVRGVGDAVLRRDARGLGRAAAIVIGFSATALGYLSGSLRVEQAARERGFSGLRAPR
jgi:GT2 family glycosyltransferase